MLEGGEAVETFADLDLGIGDANVATVVNKTSTKVKVELKLDDKADLANQLELVKPGVYPLEKAAPKPVPVNGRKFAGSESARNGINGLAVAEDVTMVIVPDLVTAATKEDGTVDLDLWKAVQTALISHCEQNGNRMAVLDAPPGHNAAADQGVALARSRCTTRRTPRCTTPGSRSRTRSAVNGDAEMLIPPSGHIAGVWARTDDTRGVWKAPANDTMRGVPRHRAHRHPERAVPAQPDRHQLHPPVRHPRHPHLGCSHPLLGHRLELHQRPAPVQHGRGDDPRAAPSGRSSSPTT